MLGLLDCLRANHFKTFIVSGSGAGFGRPWALDLAPRHGWVLVSMKDARSQVFILGALSQAATPKLL
jgi:NAD(P)-dependent dehydrogenase (short-subunit alcohol dehydrogenase family)